jgi:hypothetical protein
MIFEIGPNGELIGVRAIDENHVMVIRDAFGTVRFLNVSGTVVSLIPGQPLGDVRFATPAELARFDALAPVTFYQPLDGADLGLDDGTGSLDWVTYQFNTGLVGVSVDMGSPTPGGSNDGYGDVDTFVGIENVHGSPLDDSITGDGFGNILEGDAGDDSIEGMAGNDTLHGQPGDDWLDGGAGIDWVNYEFVPGPGGIIVDLQGGSATNDGYGNVDPIINVENVRGSAFNDSIIGTDPGDNVLDGFDGNDILLGLLGNDTPWETLATMNSGAVTAATRSTETKTTISSGAGC